jgi:hypothetical protein
MWWCCAIVIGVVVVIVGDVGIIVVLEVITSLGVLFVGVSRVLVVVRVASDGCLRV